jgi:hypothetical protein
VIIDKDDVAACRKETIAEPVTIPGLTGNMKFHFRGVHHNIHTITWDGVGQWMKMLYKLAEMIVHRDFFKSER